MEEQFIIKGEDFERFIDSGLGEIFFKILEVYGGNVLQIDAYTKKQHTGVELLNKSVRLAKWLQIQGFKQGDVVAIYSDNRLEYSVFAIACFYLGIGVATINPQYTVGELQHTLNLSDPLLICCTPDNLKKFMEIWPKNLNIKQVILIGAENVQREMMIGFDDILKGLKMNEFKYFEPKKLDPAETVGVIHISSGTTGLPKGVKITHKNFTTVMEIARILFNNFEIGHIPENECTISLLPFFHSYGFMLLCLNLIRGMKSIIIRNFSLKLLLESIQNYKVTCLALPPAVVILLVKDPMTKNYDLSSIKNIRCGSAPLGNELEYELEKTFKVSVSQAYGMTETTLAVLANRKLFKKPGSVGLIVPGMMCKVIDENGKALGPHQEGELCFKGPLIMKGYIKDPVVTAATVDKDGWLHTGDVGYYDEDLYFYIVDRIKELIKFKSYQVAPAELEALLLTHEGVSDAAVVGKPDEIAGELPYAFIVKKPGYDITESEIKQYVASKVSSYKHLTGGVTFINEIPRNTPGKILRRTLRKMIPNTKSKL